jgi:hypothetical protein
MRTYTIRACATGCRLHASWFRQHSEWPALLREQCMTKLNPTLRKEDKLNSSSPVRAQQPTSPPSRSQAEHSPVARRRGRRILQLHLHDRRACPQLPGVEFMTDMFGFAIARVNGVAGQCDAGCTSSNCCHQKRTQGRHTQLLDFKTKAANRIRALRYVSALPRCTTLLRIRYARRDASATPIVLAPYPSSKTRQTQNLVASTLFLQAR